MREPTRYTGNDTNSDIVVRLMRTYSSNRGLGTAARLVALVALVAFQLAYAGHENLHAAGEHGQACAACAHLDQNTPAAPDGVPDVSGLPAAADWASPALSEPVAVRSRAYAIRGPPRS